MQPWAQQWRWQGHDPYVTTGDTKTKIKSNFTPFLV